MDKTSPGWFQIFSLCAMSSMLGLFVTSEKGFDPGYFWAVILLFLLQSGTIFLLGNSLSSGCQMDALLPRVLRCIFFCLLGVALTLRASITLSFQTDSIALYLLEDTPNLAVMLVLLTTAFFALLPGLRRLSGVATLLTLLMSGTIILIAVTGFMGSDPGELRTLVQPSVTEFTGGLIPAAITASGAECTLFFLGSNRPDKRHIHAAAAAPAVCAVIFALLCCASVGTIGIGGMKSEPFPLVEATRQINMGGIELTERFDLPLLVVSLFTSLVQIAICTLCAAHSFRTALGRKHSGGIAAALLPAEIITALLIQYTSIDRIIAVICAVTLPFFSIIFLPLFALVSSSRKKEVKAG